MSDATSPRYSYRQLNELDVLDVERLIAMYTIELGGEELYNMIADRIANPAAAELLRRNAREEGGHARRLARAIAIKQGSPFDPTPEMQQSVPPRLPDQIDAGFLQYAMKAEFDGDLGYQRWADNEPDADVQRLLRLNGRE